jgi:class 3 adenylate cyclase
MNKKLIISAMLFILANSLFAIDPVILTEDKGEYPLGLHLEILEDKDGKLTLDDIRKPEMEKLWVKSKVEVPSFGMTDSAYWLRFQLQSSIAKPISWFLEIAFPPIDYLDFYLMEENGNYSLTQTGDRRPFNTRQYNNKNYLFNIPIEANKTRDIYIKTWSQDGLHESIPIVLYDKDTYIEKSSRADTVMGIYIGILLVMILYNLFIFLSVKDIAYLYYILFIFGFINWVLIFYGYTFQYLLPSSPMWANQSLTLSAIFTSAMIVSFSRTFLSASRLIPRIDSILKFSLVLLYIYFPLSFILNYSTIWKFIIITVALTCIMLMVSGVLCFRKGYRPARYFLIAWTSFLLGGTLMLLKVAAVIPSNFITENGIIIGAVLQVILLSLGLADRINELKRQNELIRIKNQKELQKLNNELEQKVIDRTFHLEQAKSKIETLNDITKTVNSNLDIEKIMNTLIDYLDQKYKINVCALYTINLQERTIENYYLNIREQIPDSLKEIARKIKFQLDDQTHAHGYVYKKGTALYAKTLRNPENKNEEIIINTLKLKSSLIIPLHLHNEIIGFLDLTRTKEELVLFDEDIESLVTLSNQVTGAINNSKLMKQAEQAKEQADIERSIALIAQQETEAAKMEVDKLNKITKRINSVASLTDVMTFIMYHLEKEYKFRDFWLLLKDDISDRLKPFSYSSPGMSEDTYQYFMNFMISLEEECTFSTTYKEQKMFYLPLDENNNLSDIDKQIIEHGKFTFLLQIPFVVYEETIGILCIHNKSMEKLSNDLLEKLQNLSNQVAGAINNSKLFKQSQVAQQEAEAERHKSEKLLLNILPEDVARELKEKGFAEPVLFESVSVMFTDFKGFTQIAETMSPSELLKELDGCFIQFDKITERYHLEKLKTIGDSYMCAGGIPGRNTTHPIDTVLAALEIQAFMSQMKDLKLMMDLPYWELRLGIHTGSLIAGVIGEKKFAYDVWGDTVNTASRMESSGTPGMINISGATYELIKEYFECEFRGMINAKNKGEVAMHYVNRLKEEYSKDEDGRVPNEKFWESYNNEELRIKN